MFVTEIVILADGGYYERYERFSVIKRQKQSLYYAVFFWCSDLRTFRRKTSGAIIFTIVNYIYAIADGRFPYNAIADHTSFATLPILTWN